MGTPSKGTPNGRENDGAGRFLVLYAFPQDFNRSLIIQENLIGVKFESRIF